MNVTKAVAELQSLTVNELRQRYEEEFRESTRCRNRTWLVRRIAWRLQAIAEGDLSERARLRAAKLANESDLRVIPPRCLPIPTRASSSGTKPDHRLPPPGTVITRAYKGDILQVRVLTDGFEYDGSVYKTLSAVAKQITGSHCNGLAFFRRGGRA